MDILQILREIERFKADAPPYTYLVFEKRYGVRRAVWAYADTEANSSTLFFYGYKTRHGDFHERSTAAHVTKWFEEGNMQIYQDREEWLLARQKTIGASDVPTIIGVNPWKSAYTLWAEKTGRIEQAESTIAARMGLALEGLIEELYEENTGRILHGGGLCMHTHPEIPWLTCTPDRYTYDENDTINRVIELKTIGENAARKLVDGQPPLAYQVQLQIQMEILGCQHGDLACLIGNRGFQVFEFERHDKLIEGVIRKCAEFYHHMASDTPPPLDGSESTLQTIKALHPDDNGETVELPEEAVIAAQVIERIKADKKRLEAEENAARVIILNAIGDATFANGQGVSVSYKTIEGKPYTVQSKKYRRLTITTNKETDDE